MRAATGRAASCGPLRQSRTPAVPATRDGPSEARQPRASQRAPPFCGEGCVSLPCWASARPASSSARHSHPPAPFAGWSPTQSPGRLRPRTIEQASRHPIFAPEIDMFRASLTLVRCADDLLFRQSCLLYSPSLPCAGLRSQTIEKSRGGPNGRFLPPDPCRVGVPAVGQADGDPDHEGRRRVGPWMR